MYRWSCHSSLSSRNLIVSSVRTTASCFSRLWTFRPDGESTESAADCRLTPQTVKHTTQKDDLWPHLRLVGKSQNIDSVKPRLTDGWNNVHGLQTCCGLEDVFRDVFASESVRMMSALSEPTCFCSAVSVLTRQQLRWTLPSVCV